MLDRLPAAPDKFPPSHEAASAGGGSILFDLLTHLRRRKAFILGVTLACCVATALLLLALPRRYTAEATIQIDFHRQQVLDLPDVTGDLPPERQTIWAVVWSEAERLTTWPLLNQVIDKLGLGKDPDLGDAPTRPPLWAARIPMIERAFSGISAAVAAVRTAMSPPALRTSSADAARSRIRRRLEQRLSVRSDPNSGLIHVWYTSSGSAEAARVLNALTAAYVADARARKSGEIQQALDWLGGNIETLQKNATTARRAVEQYRIKTGIYSSNGKDIASDRMGRFSEQLAASMAEEASLAARYKQIASLGGDAAAAAPEVLDSPVIQELRGAEGQLVGELGYLTEQHLDRYPDVRNTRAQIAKIRDQMATEVRRIAAGVRNQLGAAHAKTENLRARLASAESEVAQQRAGMVRLSELESVASANESIYQAFLQRIDDLAARVAVQKVDASVFAPALAPDRPSFPRKGLILAFVALVAASGASLVVLIRETHDRGFSSAAEVERLTGLPALGVVPLMAAAQAPGGYALRSRGIEALYLEMLGAASSRLRQSLRNAGSRVVLVTSAAACEGKTTASLALARIAAHQGQRVLLVDCDLSRPSLSQRVASPTATGLAEVLDGAAHLDEALVADAASPAQILPGGVRQDPFSRFSSSDMIRLIRDLRERFDLILLDAPPLLGLSDAHDITMLAEQTLLIVQWRRTPQRVVSDALRQIRHSGAQVVGCLLTRVDLRPYMLYDATELKDLAKHYYRSKKGRPPSGADVTVIV